MAFLTADLAAWYSALESRFRLTVAVAGSGCTEFGTSAVFGALAAPFLILIELLILILIELEQLLAAQIQAPLADGTDVTEWLPDTLLDTILLFSSIRDMNRAGRVSKRWKRLVDSPRCQNFHRTLDVRMAK